VQLIAGEDGIDQPLPVFRRGPGLRTVAFTLARRTTYRAGVAEIAAQQLDDIADQLLRFCLTDVGQIIVRNISRIAERPGVGFTGVRMNTGGDDLLTVAHEFDFLAGAAIGGDQVDGDLGEWISGAKYDGALWRPADPRQDSAARFKPLAYQILDCDGSELVENVGVESRRVPGQDPGVGRARPVSAPRLQHLARHVFDLLPSLERRLLADDRNRHIATVD
jgi:hypothetical protein